LAEQGSAKFDKAKKTLMVTLPVAAEVTPAARWTPPDSEGQTDADLEVELRAAKAAEDEAKRKVDEEEAAKRAAARAEKQRWRR